MNRNPEMDDWVSSDPKLSSEWHPTRNRELSPSAIRKSSGQKIWWRCDQGHEWQAAISKRSLGFAKCVSCLSTSRVGLFDAYPSLRVEFDSEENGEPPAHLSPASHLKFWWVCRLGHKYLAVTSSRALGTSCPYCSNQKVLSGFNDMATTHPELAKYLDIEKSGVDPSQIFAGTGKELWWTCNLGHSSSTSGDKKKKNPSSCPYCSNKSVLSGFNDMATTHPYLAHEFDSDKNKPLTPADVVAGTQKRLWWLCPKGHSYEVDGMHRVTQQTNCPYCASKQILAGFNDMATLAPQLVPHFHPTRNEPGTPQTLAYRTNRTLWWMCELGHEYQAKPGNRLQEGGLGCPVCSNHKVLSGYNDMATTNPALAEEWHPTKNGSKQPSHFTSGSNKKAWWLCAEGHEWYAFINLRSRGRNCPRCSNGGFDNTKPGWLYLIENAALRSRKIGISNHESKRIDEYLEGWTLVHLWKDKSGEKVRRLETLSLKYIRSELGLPRHLSEEDMGHAGGSSETFSGEGISNEELIDNISTIYYSLEEI